MKVWLLLLAAVVVLWALHRLALWAESRGWIYYLRRQGSSGAMGNALLEVQALLEPSTRHVLEERQEEHVEEAESGDPPRGQRSPGEV